MPTTNAVKLHRVIRAQPDRLYKAFLQPDVMAKWLPPYGFTCTVHHMEAVVGGTFKMSFTNFGSGNGHSFGGEYLELIPGAKFATPTSLKTPTCPARCRPPSP